jgi:anti-sigma B factor antagonist
MDITINSPADNISIIHVFGKFTIEDVNFFKEKTSPLVKDPVKTILANFSDLNYIDSSGIGALILLMNTAKNLNVELVLYNIPKEIHNVFKIAYLDKFFHITTSQELKKQYPDFSL